MRKSIVSWVVIFCTLAFGAGMRAAHAQNELFITNDGGNSVTVFPRTATGDPVSRVIAGAATGRVRIMSVRHKRQARRWRIFARLS